MGIRANTGLAEIEVNDNGDKISFAISDNNFIKQFFDFVDWFSKTKDDIEKMSTKKEGEEEDFDAVYELVKAQESLSNRALEKLENLFGAGTCKKIFGNVSPTFLCVTDIVFQLSGELERIVKEHNQYYASMYSRNRKANRRGRCSMSC